MEPWKQSVIVWNEPLRALTAAGVEHAVVGGNAVAVWVGMVDRGAVRNTRDVDILLRRGDLTRATDALKQAGFVPAYTFGVTVFLDGPEAKPSESIHIVFAGEKVQSDYAVPAPDVGEAERPTAFPVIALEPLVRMKLTSFRLKDRVHIQDLIGVGLVECFLAPALASAARRATQGVTRQSECLTSIGEKHSQKAAAKGIESNANS